VSSDSWKVQPAGAASDFLGELPLVDHHVHGVIRENPSVDSFSHMITESDRTPTSLHDAMNTQVGFATRRWVAPLLELEPSVSATDYFERRIELGADEVNRRLLQASGIGHYFIETGLKGADIHDPAGMAELSGAKVDHVIRIETVAEEIARSGVSAVDFSQHFMSALDEQAKSAVGLKTVVAYRIGLDFDSTPPSELEVEQAAGRWLSEVASTGKARVSDPILLRHLIFAAANFKKPLQFHIGFGDPDLYLDRCDPLLMTDLIRDFEKREIPVMLLHTYPYHRNAGYLAQMFRNVYMDVGLAINYTGARSNAIIAESLELAPFHKILFSSDAWGLPELTYLGAMLFRRGLGELLDSYIARGDWSNSDAISVARQIGHDNALSAYGINR
jgi:predicted TIM-barrel fold metal-dependent hydrolase